MNLPTQENPVLLLRGDCLEIMPELPDSCVDLILTDPPYFRVKDDDWDRQWRSDDDFLDWIGNVSAEWYRILKPNGSLYCFASPQMASRVEVTIGERFSVLNHLVWAKHDGQGNGQHSRQSKEECRSFFPRTERIIFAEHKGADGIAKGERGYGAECDRLKGFVFEPLRKYFDDERVRCGISNEEIMDGMEKRGVGRFMFARHTFTRSQWVMPTRETYEAARDLFNTFKGGPYLEKDYKYLRREYDLLKREYDELRGEYESLRRVFRVTPETPYTDVWTFPTVPPGHGRHPCEKPPKMIRYMMEVSSNPGAVVLDCFAGSGVVGDVAQRIGRRAILVEKDPEYFSKIRKRLGTAPDPDALFASSLFRPKTPPKETFLDGFNDTSLIKKRKK